MPMVTVFTNASRALVTEAFATELGKSVGTHLNRPEEYVTVRVVPEQLMFTGGKPTPFAHVDVISLSGLGPDKNREMAPDITKIVEEHLKIPKILLTFDRIDPTDCGIDGKTFPTWISQDE
ncbi:hypothetical protein LOTGIDRAFT_176471 [Lottia gigantea]|uniref:L-dopachrome isomerase n=1 Tax=Lottia gigantea TaxID=225164 RepID=V4AZ68_LOTGI|nr:hypothetical protein LOTGIDRAFT_176471 [Lottia gigantea]ESP00411.1 hypothetical protein LOTGIDRAFT_176471 [Lottia gigantea]